MNRVTRVLVLGLVVAAVGLAGLAAVPEKTEPERFFEMRTYTANEGKMADLHKRFREHTNRLFVKHGMTLVGYWTPADGAEKENTLVYILAYPSREAREKSWKEFQADPDWQAAYKASHAAGPLVKKAESKFFLPTDYSPIK